MSGHYGSNTCSTETHVELELLYNSAKSCDFFPHNFFLLICKEFHIMRPNPVHFSALPCPPSTFVASPQKKKIKKNRERKLFCASIFPTSPPRIHWL